MVEIPVPVGGLNLSVPVTSTPRGFTTEALNVICRPGFVEARPGVTSEVLLKDAQDDRGNLIDRPAVALWATGYSGAYQRRFYPALQAAMPRTLAESVNTTSGLMVEEAVNPTNVFNTNREIAEAVTEDTTGYTGICLLYTSPSPRDRTRSRMPSSA